MMLSHSRVMRLLDTLAVTNTDEDIKLIYIEAYDVDHHKKDEHEAETISGATEFMLDQSITQGRFTLTLK